MFQYFTEKAIKVMMLAQEEARRLGHNFVGTEQILLGLLGEGTGVAAKVLAACSVNLKDARVEVEKIIGRGSAFVAVEIPFTPRSKRVLELSWNEASLLGHNYIGTEHLLLGLIREGEGVAARVLEILGVDLVMLRTKILEALPTPPANPIIQVVSQEVKNESSARALLYEISAICRQIQGLDLILSRVHEVINLPFGERTLDLQTLFDGLTNVLGKLDDALARKRLTDQRKIIAELLQELRRLQSQEQQRDKQEPESETE